MAAVFPSINVLNNPVTITTANSLISYQQILGLIQYTSYDVNVLNLQSGSINQFNEAFIYNKKEATGEITQNPMFGFIDPDQIQPTLNLNVPDGKLIIDNSTTFSFNLLPNQYLQVELWAKTSSFGYLLRYPSEYPKKVFIKNVNVKKRKKIDDTTLIAGSLILMSFSILYGLHR